MKHLSSHIGPYPCSQCDHFSEEEIATARMKLVCTVTLINRAAEASGVNSRMGRPAKSVIQFRNLPDGGKQILLSTNKDVSGQRFNVMKNVIRIREAFIGQGMLTVEIKDPQVNLMIKDANTVELKKFLATLKGEDRPPGPGVPEVEGAKKNEVVKPGKRSRSPEISKVEESNIRKCLKTGGTSLTISVRKSYPLNIGFSPDLINLTVEKINLRRIDPKILALRNLSALDLSNNLITSVDKLKLLHSPLQRLVLASNQIERMDEDLFLNKALESLGYLDLRGNKLKLLPNSIVYLGRLQSLLIADNKLECLPYNMHFMRSLKILKAQNNKFNFIPKPIIQVGLLEADVSSNPIKSDVNDWTTSHFGSIGCPTVFELAAESLLNQNINNPEKAFYKLGRNMLPQIIREYLTRGKKCESCQRMTVRYCYRIQTAPTRLLASQVIGHPIILFKAVTCHTCSNTFKCTFDLVDVVANLLMQPEVLSNRRCIIPS